MTQITHRNYLTAYQLGRLDRMADIDDNRYPFPTDTGALLWNAWRQGWADKDLEITGPLNFDGEMI